MTASTNQAIRPSNVRADAARILCRLLSQQGSLATLNEHKGNYEDQALLREMCYGTCRWYFQLDAFLRQLISKPLKAKDLDIQCLLLIGLYQLHYLRVPDYAVVNETVTAALALKKPWAKGLINAVLRQFLRLRSELELQTSPSESAFYAHPEWLIRKLKQAWPAQWGEILTANNQHPPMTLRVNQQKVSRSDYLKMLADEGIAAQPGRLTDTAIYLEEALPVVKLPGFAEGLLSVQDEASQLIPGLLALTSGLNVLDACAAPGGKTCHLLESEHPPARLLALDNEEHRLSRVRENLDRLSLDAELLTADASDSQQWWDGRFFDRILLDAPCSASGIIRRQPDIKVLRRAADIPRLVALQEDLLESLWPCLKPGGLLLYSTCSVLPDENTALIADFISRHIDAKHEAIDVEWGVECGLGRQLLPADKGTDGFYFARLRKSV
jgi:16S rRNA (cytosine967-C5)-methyltransferase